MEHAKKLQRRDRNASHRKSKIESARPDFLGFWATKYRWDHVGFRSATLTIPASFSFLDNAEETLGTLHKLVGCVRSKSLTRIHFDHSKCESLDLCASAVMDIILLLGKKTSKLRHRKIVASGVLSQNDDVNVLLRANGLLRALGHPGSMNIPPELIKRLKIFPLRGGSKSPPDRSTATERVSSELVAFFNSCLERQGFKLQEQKERTLVDMIAEILVNAEDHSALDQSKFGDHWHAIGYYKEAEVQGDGGECHIVLFNFGRSIYESLKSDETSEQLKIEISRLASLHQKAGYFDLIIELTSRIGLIRKRFWEEEALWTVYALQEGVSRYRHKPGNEDRGNGTIRMIEFFTELAPNGPKMVLVSGRTWVKFDGTYTLGTIMKKGEQRQVIAFNEANDLAKPPDPKYIRTLDQAFPGTLMSLKFSLLREDLAKVEKGLKRNADS